MDDAEGLFAFSEDESHRVLILPDPHTDAPYDDGATPILTMEYRHGWHVSAFNRQGEPYVYALARFLNETPDGNEGRERFARWVRVFHGGHGTAEYGPNQATDYHYMSFDTDKWAEGVGCPDEYRATAADGGLSEIQAWLEGDTWGWRVERRVDGVKTYTDGREAEPFTEWEDVDSCWGFYGRDHVKQEALTALDDAQKEG